MNAQSMLENALNGIAGTPLPGLTASTPRAAGALRDPSKRDDREMLPPRAMLNHKLEISTGSSADERVRSDPRMAPRPAGFLATNAV